MLSLTFSSFSMAWTVGLSHSSATVMTVSVVVLPLPEPPPPLLTEAAQLDRVVAANAAPAEAVRKRRRPKALEGGTDTVAGLSFSDCGGGRGVIDGHRPGMSAGARRS